MNRDMGTPYKVMCTLFGLRGRTLMEDVLTRTIHELPIDRQFDAMTPYFNHILSNNKISVVKKSFILNAVLGPCMFGDRLPKRFLNIPRTLLGIEGVRYLELGRDFTYDDVEMLSNLHTGITRRLTYQGLVSFMLDKKLHEKYPEEHTKYVNLIKEASSQFVTDTIDDVHKLLNLGLRPIPLTKPKDCLYELLRKETNWTYVHGCLYNYLQGGYTIDISDCEEKLTLSEDESILVYIVLGSYTGITNIKLYRWLCKLVLSHIKPYMRSASNDVDMCVCHWQQKLHRSRTPVNELLFWIYRYKEEFPTCVDSYVNTLGGNLTI